MKGRDNGLECHSLQLWRHEEKQNAARIQDFFSRYYVIFKTSPPKALHAIAFINSEASSYIDFFSRSQVIFEISVPTPLHAKAPLKSEESSYIDFFSRSWVIFEFSPPKALHALAFISSEASSYIDFFSRSKVIFEISLPHPYMQQHSSIEKPLLTKTSSQAPKSFLKIFPPKALHAIAFIN